MVITYAASVCDLGVSDWRMWVRICVVTRGRRDIEVTRRRRDIEVTRGQRGIEVARLVLLCLRPCLGGTGLVMGPVGVRIIISDYSRMVVVPLVMVAASSWISRGAALMVSTSIVICVVGCIGY